MWPTCSQPYTPGDTAHTTAQVHGLQNPSHLRLLRARNLHRSTIVISPRFAQIYLIIMSSLRLSSDVLLGVTRAGEGGG